MVALASNSNRSPLGAEPKIHPGIVENKHVTDPFQRRHRLVAKRGPHIAQGNAPPPIDGPACRPCRSEIMHFPVPRYRQVQRIDLTADHHHPVFPRVAVGAASIEIFDDQQFIAGQTRRRRGQFGRLLHQTKIAPGMIPGRAQQ